MHARQSTKKYLTVGILTSLPFLVLFILVLTQRHALTHFDISVGQHLYHWGSPAFTNFVQTYTYLGNTPGVIITTLIIATLFSWISKKWRVGLWTILSIFTSTGLIVGAIKYTVKRIRPEYVAHLVDQTGFSFPSGHATGSIVVWGTLAFLIWHYYGDKHPKLKLPLILFVAFMMIALGGSRLYLGVHYFTDVIAGWSLGASCLIWSSYLFHRCIDA